MKKNTLLLGGLILACSVFSQRNQSYPEISHTSERHNGIIRCASMENDSLLRAKHPELGTWQMNEAFIQQKIKEHKEQYPNGNPKSAVITIPVVVHVIHNGDAIGTGENITDAQVLSQIDVLNQDFRRLSGTPGFNSDPNGADTEIEFCMAVVDPSGNPTNGINRVNLGTASYTMNGVETNVKPATQWDPTQYCNMWSVRFGGADAGTLGYAQFPSNSGLPGLNTNGGAANTDGVVAAYSSFGSSDIYPAGIYNAPYDKGRTMTHEVGHWLGLRHIWGDGGCTVDDFCADTPTSDQANYGCPAGHTSCGSTDMIENYMDYTDDDCMNIFTNDQKTRIQTVMSVCPRRVELASSTVCTPLATNDAGITAIFNPNGDYCNLTSFAPLVTLENFGSSTLTSVTISYYIDANTPSTYTWTGSLTTGSTIDVTLPALSTSSGTHTFTASASLPNGNTDENPSNDFTQTSYTATAGTAITFTLDTDCWGFDTYWELENSASTVIQSGGNTSGIPPGGAQGAAATDPGAYGNQITITEEWCLADGCYDFTIYDDWGDGLAGVASGCAIDGSYSIDETISGTNLASILNVNFGNSETQNFCITSACSNDAGTMNTTAQTICGTANATATHNNDETLDTGDALEFVLHTNSGTTLGSVIATNSTPTFGFTGGMSYGTTYYISAIAGDDLSGSVDQADPCLSVAEGTAVTWNDLPNVSAGADQDVCSGNQLTLNGSGAISYSWNNGISDGIAFTPAATTTYQVTGTDANGCQNSDETVVTVNSLPSVSAGADQTVCNGSAVTLSGSGALSYSWNNGITDGTAFTATSTTIYTVTGTDLNGCENSDQVTVNVNGLPSVSAGADESICVGESVTLSGSGALSYSWDNGVTDGTGFTPVATNTYQVTGTDGNGCQNTDQVLVTVNSLPNVSAGADQDVCSGNQLILNGSGAISYSWNNGISDGIAFTPAATTTYQVTGTDANGCQNTDETVVTVNSLPSVSAGADQTVCNGSAVTLSGSGALSYSWNNGITDGTAFTATSTTIYTVTGTDLNGCENSDQVTVNVNGLPSVSAGADESICLGESVTLSGSGALSYNWDNGVTDGTAFTPASTNTYQVTGTDGNGCQNTDQVLVTVNSLPNVSAGTDQSICAGSSLTLSGSGASSYSWDNGVTNGVSFTPSATNTYQVTGTDNNGCQNTDQVIVTMNSAPSTASLIESCNGTNTAYTVSFDVSGGTLPYSVSGIGGNFSGSTFTSNAINSGISYNITVTDDNGCAAPVITGVQNCSCTTNSGTMQTSPTLSLCGNGSQTAIHNNDETLDGDDIMQYYLHTASGSTLGSVIAISANPTFSFTGGMSYGTTYYVSAVVGTNDGSGNIDMADACLSIASGTPVIWNENPVVNAGVDQIICEGNQAVVSGSGAISYTWTGGVTDGVNFTPAATQSYTVTGTDANGCQDSDQLTITVNALPNVSGGTDQIICEGTATILNGSGANNYSWNNGVSDGVVFTPTASTTYTVTGTDNNGCSNSDQIIITVNANPSVDAGVDQVICEGNQATVSGSGAVSYIWSGGVSDGQSFTPTTTQFYTVTGTDANGCQGTDQLNISVNSLPNVSAGVDQVVCEGTSVTLSGSGANNYSWNNGVSNGVAFTPSTSATYTVTGTDNNGCIDSDQVQITVNANPTVSAGNDQVICAGELVTLSGSGASSYTWNGGVTDGLSFSPNSTQTYTVTGTDNNGCSNSDQVIVTVNANPSVSAGNDQAICEGQSITLTGSGAQSYNWNNGVSDGIAFSPNTTTTYLLTGTASNGCIATDQVTITVNPSPSVDAGADQSICEGQTVTLSASNPDNASLSWDNGITDGLAFTPSVGAITYTATANLNGCVNSDQVMVTVNAVPSIDAGVDFARCEGQQITLSANNPDNASISWNNGVTDGVPFDQNTGTVTYIVTADLAGCIAQDQIDVTVNEVPIISGQVTHDDGSSNGAVDITITGGSGSIDNISWNNGSNNEDITDLSAGDYTVTITDLNGCSASETFTVLSTVGLSDRILNYQIYPNPTSGKVKIILEGDFNYELRDVRGRIILKGDHKNEAEFNLEQFERGIYLLYIFQSSNYKTEKIILQ